MLKFIIKRIGVSLGILLGILFFLCLLFQLQPGNPYFNFIKPGMTPEQIEQMLISKGYYDSVSVKFSKTFFSILHFNFGYSLQYNEPVHALILQRLPRTLFLTVPALFFAVLCSIPIGIHIAYYPKKLFSRLVDIISGITICTPAFFIAIFLIKLLAFDLPLFPISGIGTITLNGIESVLSKIHSAALPILTLTIMQTAPLIRYMRGFMNSIKDEDFIITYHGFGLSKYEAYKKAGFRAIMPKLSTMIFMEVPYLISGAVITETVFVWNGIGKLNFDAVLFRDYPLLLGITGITAAIVLCSNLAADIFNFYLDKRMGL